MRNVLIFALAGVAGLATWMAYASWQWGRLDTPAVFRARIASEAPPGSNVTVLPGTLRVGDLGGGARLVCGSVSLGSAQSSPQTRLYSLVLVKTLFGYAINDGFTPATRPENQTTSDQNCAALSAHAAAHPETGTH